MKTSAKVEGLNNEIWLSGCVTYISHEQGIVFTGDTLLIRGCGRTDPPHGDPETLFDSIFNQIFSLPDTFRVYPGRDYNGSYWFGFAAKRN